MASVENYLKRFGFDPGLEAARLNSLPQKDRVGYFLSELGGFTSEVLAGKLVSHKYSYWFGQDDKLYAATSLEPVYLVDQQVDVQERGGLFLDGIYKAGVLVKRHPGSLVALYSPTGPAAFPGQTVNKFTKINYGYGQLYLFVGDGNRVDSVAVSISDETEGSFLAQSLGSVYHQAEGSTDRYWRIADYLLHPTLLGEFDEFLDKPRNQKQWVFTNGQGKQFNVGAVIRGIKAELTGKSQLLPAPAIYLDQTLAALEKQQVTAEMIFQAYMQTIQAHMEGEGLREMSLAGSCGGSLISLGEVNGYLLRTGVAFSIESIVSSLSSVYRLITQGEAEGFACPRCEGIIPPGSGDICPHCGYTKQEHAAKTGITCG